MARILPYILLLVLSSLSLSAQYREHFFTHYGKREGLSANETTSIIQDEKGFLWIGTFNGLQRYDGTRFLTFRQSEEAGHNLPSSYITQLYFDRQHRLWLFFSTGNLGIFDTKKFLYTEVRAPTPDSSLARRPKKLMEDASGNLLLLAPPLLFKYNEQTGNFENAQEYIKIPPGWKINNILPDLPSKKFWIASDSGLAVFNAASGKLSYRDHNEENEPAIRLTDNIRFIDRMLIDAKQRIWLKSFPPPRSQYVIYMVQTKPGHESIVSHKLDDQLNGFHDLWSFLAARSGSVWIRGYRLLAEYSEKEGKFKVVHNGIVNDWGIQYEIINALYEDREQNIWIATNSNGIYRFNPTTEFFQSIHYSEKDDRADESYVSSFVNMRDGGLLTAVNAKGLYRYDSQLNNVPVNISGLPKEASINTMFRSKNNRILVIGTDRGLYIYDEVNNRTSVVAASRFNNGIMSSLFEDRSGNIWVGTVDQGLFQCIRSDKWQIVKIPAFPAINITGSVTDIHGFLWVSTLGEGIFKIDPATNTILKRLGPEGPKQPLTNITCMILLNDSTLLFGHDGLMLYDLIKDTVRQLGFGKELLENIVSLEKDRSGRIWAGVTNGLCRLDLQKESIIFFDRGDGMINDVFSVGASASLPDGRLVFGANNSFLVFDPQQIEKREALNAPEYTGFSVGNKSLLIDSLLNEEIISLDRDNNSITIGYSGMSFRKDYKVFYMLEGLDKEWQGANELNQAIYSYLPAGSYTFRMKTEDDNGVSTEAIPLKITVHPPFWLTWWFYALVALALALIFFWVDRERMEKRKALQHMRSQIANDLHHEINVTLNNIYMLSEMARIKADNNAPLSKEYIGQIHDKSRTMITAMDDILWSINPENDNMDKFFRRMRELRDALSSAYDATISVSIADKVKALDLDVKHRLLFFLLFKDALHTVVHDANGKNTVIDIDLVKGELLFRLQDDTACFDKKTESIGKTIKSLQDRVNQLKGELDIQSGEKGVIILFRSPVS